ncbi:NAD-dependent epimerase/dehydratase family protein [Candidatus Bathyarchaeota archaeon]|nr:NAD-dependent epimerase/dehydratase family protein [Candidatus Bathyarchaeota archaeon]
MADRLTENVLITGGLGFIGSHIVDALGQNAEHKPVAYDLQPPDSAKGNVVVIRGDVFDSVKLQKAVRDHEISRVIHMVGFASIPGCNEKPSASFRLNVSSVHSILETMRVCDVERVVFPSTAAVYGVTNGPQVNEKAVPNPTTVYGCHKLAAEMLIRGYAESYGFEPTVLRLFNVYGDLHKEQGMISQSLRKAVAGEPIVVNGGNQLRDFVLLSDVVKAFVKSLDGVHDSQTAINVGSGVGVSIREIAEMITRSFPNVQILYNSPHNGEYSIYADVSRMKNVLGCVATSPSVGIPRFIEECKCVSPLEACSQP